MSREDGDPAPHKTIDLRSSFSARGLGCLDLFFGLTNRVYFSQSYSECEGHVEAVLSNQPDAVPISDRRSRPLML